MKHFDWQQYIANYPDLQRADISTEKSAWRHYRLYGMNEGRTDKNINKFIHNNKKRNDNVIFVTAFKDIGRENWKNFERSENDYLNYFQNLIKLNIRLICFCENDLADIIKNKFNFHSIYPYDQQNTFYKYLDIETNIINSENFKNLIKHRNDPECNKPQYNIVNHNKVLFIKRAKEMFPNYSHYAWIDFGYLRNTDNNYSNFDFNNLPSKINYATFNIPVKILDPKELCIYPNNPIQGSLFIVPSNKIEWFVTEYDNMLLHYHSLNIVDDDQAIILQLYKKYPEEFILSIKDKWFDLINDYKSDNKIDVVIPTTIKDLNTLGRVVNGIRKHIINLNNIYILCSKSINIHINDIIKVEEECFPFSIDDISIKFGNKLNTLNRGRKANWYYQQLLKLYCFLYIPNIKTNIMIVDSETIFYNDYSPIENNIANYPISNEINNEYRKHISLLLPELIIRYPHISGITHQMLFQKHILQHLFDITEEIFFKRYNYRLQFWEIMLFFTNITSDNVIEYSEYDLYFNFVLSYYNNSIKINNIPWDISAHIPEINYNIYLTCHSHIRNKKIEKEMFKINNFNII
jgi:hypothetical protein